jgi:CDP-diacylglycerol--glycerol-3-phosphate 3-phosphatidyltransferase
MLAAALAEVFSLGAVVPFIIIALWEDTPERGYIAAVLFIIASISDYYDGHLARLYKVESTLGKFIDPIADKILVSSTLIMMIPTKDVSPILVILLLSRDTLINGIRSVAAAENVIIPAGTLGKWKTGLQMVAIPAALIETDILIIPAKLIGEVGLWLSVVLSLVSGFQYMKGFAKKTKSF